MPNNQVSDQAYRHAKASDEQDVNCLFCVNSWLSRRRLPMAVVPEVPDDVLVRNSGMWLLLWQTLYDLLHLLPSDSV